MEAETGYKLLKFHRFFTLLDSQQSDREIDTNEIDTIEPLFHP